jgi:Zn-dependent M16 (insulinase) family peptidase
LDAISADLLSIGKTLFTRNNMKIALIGEEKALSAAISPADAIQQNLAERPEPHNMSNGFLPPDIEWRSELPREGWSTSSAVSFVARSFETVRMEHPDAPALAAISKIVRSMYLHREIREKGGAYGGFARYNPEDGLFCFASYRDPHIISTLKVFDNSTAFIQSGVYSEEDIKEAILQVCSEIDKPDPPGPAARKAYYRKLISLSDEARNRFKSRLLALTRNDVIAVAKTYFDTQNSNQAVAVISGEERLKAANANMGSEPLKLHRI